MLVVNVVFPDPDPPAIPTRNNDKESIMGGMVKLKAILTPYGAYAPRTRLESLAHIQVCYVDWQKIVSVYFS